MHRVRINKPAKTSVIQGRSRDSTETREHPSQNTRHSSRTFRLQPVDRPRCIEMVSLKDLKLPPRRARTHSQAQVGELADSIKNFGFVVPVVADENNVVRAGVGRVMASEKLGIAYVPVVRLERLSDAKKRAFALIDNRLAEKSRWDRNILAIELPELRDLLIKENLDITITGFSPVEVDQIAIDFEENSSEPADEINQKYVAGLSVSSPGDQWRLGSHQLSCIDARDGDALNRLMGSHRAAMAFLDPPYNVSIKKVVGRGRVKHEEFAMASGEMSSADYVSFLEKGLGVAAAVSREGAVHYVCTDWRHVEELIRAGTTVYGDMLNLAVWVKSNAGQGSFYRSQHELVGVFRVGQTPHLNNIELGRHGRSRSNVWHYAGVNSFRAGRLDDLRAHPTVKPIGLICEAMKDCTGRGDVILDTFCGSGTTILAAERVGRRAVGADIEPRFVDLAIRRWQEFTGKDAIHVQSGRCFDEMAKARNELTSESAA